MQSYTWQNLPGLLFGLLSLLAGVMSLCLPETKDVPLAQTIDEGEILAASMVVTEHWSVRAWIRWHSDNCLLILGFVSFFI